LILWIAALAAAQAEEFNPPRLTSLHPDWDAAKAALISETSNAKDVSFELLNGALAERFPGITSSPVPVLLPFDSAAYARDREGGQAKSADAYLGGFTPTGFFLPGPTGYDAVFSVRAGSKEFSDVSFGEPILVEVSAFAMTYDLPAPKGTEQDTSPRDLEKDFPGIRRVILESHLRYSFVRYGIRYVIAIQCYDAAPRARRLACRQADKVAVKALRALRLAGGNSAAEVKPFEARAITRPDTQSPDFTFHGPGKLIPGTGTKGNDGVVDYTVYAAIRYPIETAPSFANSQSFMHWGDCDQTGRAPSPGGRKDAGYRCRVNTKPLTFNEGAKENYDYPWRDNFCEHRFYFVGQCAAGVGHQGQDIRAASCTHKNEGADRCEPYLYSVVAAHDGMILRQRKQEGIYLVVNGASERVRFRYIHMNPARLDEDGVLSGRRVTAGETLGKVANYNRRENGTTVHLHFEAMVPTNDGWVRVNPYATLINGYERLIGGRGREVNDASLVAENAGPTQVAAASPMPVVATQPDAKSEPVSRHRRGKGLKSRKAKSAEHAARPKTKRARHARRR
jgi:hypothetical protein